MDANTTILGISPDWAMVIITLVYVIATIKISKSNAEATKAATEQTKELKRQFDENNRPKVEISIEFIKNAFFVVKLHNIGNQSAYNINVNINDDFINSVCGSNDSKSLLKLCEHRHHLGVSQYLFWKIGVHTDKKLFEHDMKINVSYENNGKTYYDDYNFSLISFESVLQYDSPLDEIRIHTKNIAENIKKAAISLNKISR